MSSSAQFRTRTICTRVHIARDLPEDDDCGEAPAATRPRRTRRDLRGEILLAMDGCDGRWPRNTRDVDVMVGGAQTGALCDALRELVEEGQLVRVHESHRRWSYRLPN